MPASLEPKVDYAQYNGKTLILPIVSVGNVPQLAADLIIASLRLSRMEILDPACVFPVAGQREDGREGVTTPLEVFGKEGVNIVVLQQRSPAISALKSQFTAQLATFVRRGQFAAVLLLSGVDVMARGDRHMSAPIYHYPASARGVPFEDRLTLTTPPFLPAPGPGPGPGKQMPPVPGSGLLRRVLGALQADADAGAQGKEKDKAQGEKEAPALGVLLQFVMEGDNRGDAHVLAQTAARVVDVAVPEWREPPSWRVGLFGTPQEQTLYG